MSAASTRSISRFPTAFPQLPAIEDISQEQLTCLHSLLCQYHSACGLPADVSEQFLQRFIDETYANWDPRCLVDSMPEPQARSPCQELFHIGFLVPFHDSDRRAIFMRPTIQDSNGLDIGDTYFNFETTVCTFFFIPSETMEPTIQDGISLAFQSTYSNGENVDLNTNNIEFLPGLSDRHTQVLASIRHWDIAEVKRIRDVNARIAEVYCQHILLGSAKTHRFQFYPLRLLNDIVQSQFDRLRRISQELPSRDDTVTEAWGGGGAN